MTRKPPEPTKAVLARTVKKLARTVKLQELEILELTKFEAAFENMRVYWQKAIEEKRVLKAKNESLLLQIEDMKTPEPRDPTPQELLDAAIAFMVIGMDRG